MVAEIAERAPEEREREAARQRGAARLARAQSAATFSGEFPQLQAVPDQAFRALADNVRDYAIFFLDASGVIAFWGEGAHLMKGWSKEEAEGGHLRMLYPIGGAEDGTADEHLAAAAEFGEYSGEGYRVRSDGSTFWAGVTLTALRDEDGRLRGFAKVSRDLTARRATTSIIEAARLAAEAANRAKSAFLATMSHEIRTPLNAILGYLELMELEVGGPLTVVQRTFLDRARASDRHLMELVDDVLDLSRLEADRLVVENVVGRVDSAVEGAAALVEPQARSKRLALVNRVSGVGASASVVHYRGDEARVRQIIANLLTNSVKFTDTGGRVTITSGVAAELPADAAPTGGGPWAYVRVEDTGAGIAAERLAAVFEPFVQADMSHTRRYGGSGLGLAISRRLARLMGGDITGASTPGAGSTFVLWLRAEPSGGAGGAAAGGADAGGVREAGAAGTAAGDATGADGAGAAGTSGTAAVGSGSATGAGNASAKGAGPGDTLAPGGGAGRATGATGAGVMSAWTGAFQPIHPEVVAAAPALRGALGVVAAAVLGDVRRVLHAHVARLRSDPQTASARRMSERVLEDHLGTFIADLAQSLASIDLSGATATVALRDGVAIQHVVAERHGRQRARLGWRADEVRREYQILREELGAAVRRAEGSRAAELDQMLAALQAFIEEAERASLSAFTAATTPAENRQAS